HKSDSDLWTDKGLVIEYGKYLRSINEEPDFDNIVTRLYVYGRNGLSINRLNPTGTDYIESFDYYMYPFKRYKNKNVIQSSYYMSDDLCNAILDYNDFLEYKRGQFADLLDQLENLQVMLTQKENELDVLNNQMQLILDSLDVANAAGNDTTGLNQQR